MPNIKYMHIYLFAHCKVYVYVCIWWMYMCMDSYTHIECETALLRRSVKAELTQKPATDRLAENGAVNYSQAQQHALASLVDVGHAIQDGRRQGLLLGGHCCITFTPSLEVAYERHMENLFLALQSCSNTG